MTMEIKTEFNGVKMGDLISILWLDSFSGEVSPLDLDLDHPYWDNFPRLMSVGVWIGLIRNVHILIQDWHVDGRRVCYIGIPNGCVFEIKTLIPHFLKGKELERVITRMGLADELGYLTTGSKEFWV